VSGVGGIERLRDVSIYAVDSIVRRSEAVAENARRPSAESLCQWSHADQAWATAQATKRACARATRSALLECALDDGLADDVVRIAAGHASTSTLGAMFGALVAGEGVMDAFTVFGNEAFGSAWPTVWAVIRIIVIVVPLIICVAYLTLWNAS